MFHPPGTCPKINIFVKGKKQVLCVFFEKQFILFLQRHKIIIKIVILLMKWISFWINI